MEREFGSKVMFFMDREGGHKMDVHTIKKTYSKVKEAENYVLLEEEIFGDIHTA